MPVTKQDTYSGLLLLILTASSFTLSTAWKKVNVMTSEFNIPAWSKKKEWKISMNTSQDFHGHFTTTKVDQIRTQNYK